MAWGRAVPSDSLILKVVSVVRQIDRKEIGACLPAPRALKNSSISYL